MPRRRSRRTTKRKPTTSIVESPEGVWYKVKCIIGERRVKGKVEYRIDWDNNPITGEPYQPTWEKSSDVNEQAKREWESYKLRENAEFCNNVFIRKEGSRPQELESQQSQDLRPANWRRISHLQSNANDTCSESSEHRQSEESSPGQGDCLQSTPKRQRTDFVQSPWPPSVTSSPSSVSDLSPIESEEPFGESNTSLVIPIRNAPDFDASEYVSVHNSESSVSSPRPPSRPGSRTGVFDLQPSSPPEAGAWDVNIEKTAPGKNFSQETVPDSQDPSSLQIESSNDLADVHVNLSQEILTQESHQTLDSVQFVVPDSQNICEIIEVGENRVFCHSEPVVPASTAPDCDIPSRQPGNSGIQDPGVEYIEIEIAKTSAVFAAASEVFAEIEEASPDQPQSATEFLTQPYFKFSVPSETQQTQSQAGAGVPEGGFVQNPTQEEIATARSSQAAQIVAPVFESSPHNLTETVVSDLDSQHQLQPEQVNSGSLQQVEQSTNTQSEKEKESKEIPSLENIEVREESVDSEPSTSDLPRRLAEDTPNSWGDFHSNSELPEKDPTMNIPSSPHLSSASVGLGARSNSPQTEQSGAAMAEPMSAAEEMNSLWESHENNMAAQSFSADQGFFSQPLLETKIQPTLGSDPLISSIEKSPSAEESMQQLFKETFPEDVPSNSLMLPESEHFGTISPADITKLPEAERLTLPVLPGHEGLSISDNGSDQLLAMGLPPMATQSLISSNPRVQQPGYIVTLPFQASIRALYDETLLNHRKDIAAFNDLAADGESRPDDAVARQAIEILFGLLHNLCNYPEDSLEVSVKELDQRVKYYVCANAKMNFIYELLSGISGTETTVLIVAHSLELLRLFLDIADFLKLDCTCDELQHTGLPVFNSSVRLTLSLVDKIDVRQFDLVIAYDSTFNNSRMLRDLSKYESDQHVLLRLATAFSIEHLEMEMTESRNSWEYIGELLWGIVAARDHNNDGTKNFRQPHEIAKLFCDHLNHGDIIHWKPDPLPKQVLDAWVSTQSQSQAPQGFPLDSEGGTKRKLHDDDDDDDAGNKRMRLFSQSGAPPLTYEIQNLLDKIGVKNTAVTGEAHLKLPLEALETLAEKLAAAESAAETHDLEANTKKVIQGLQNQVTQYEKTYERMFKRHKEAIEDRSQFERQTTTATAALAAAREEHQKNEKKSQQKIAELEATVSRLHDAAPDVISANEDLLQEALVKIRTLEKRLDTAHKNEEYTRHLYQEASNTTSALRSQLNDLKEENEDLKKKASENLLKIHQVQAGINTAETQRKNAELQAQLAQMTWELKHARKELDQTRNGRRETRQSSVPRSPRMGSMKIGSPRPGRFGGSSRGASPAAAAPLGAFDSSPVAHLTTSQAGNGRFAHLRQ